MHLWHLFPAQETYKLNTFLHGGLWCSDLGSIIGFGDDCEGSGLHGVFVSCWHLSQGEPTSNAWEIFGGDGNGFALRTSIEVLRRSAITFEHPALKAKLAKVQYVQAGGTISDSAFQVPEHHQRDDEMRLAITLTRRPDDPHEALKHLQQSVPLQCSGREFQGKIEQLTLSTRNDSDFALILPIDTADFVRELLIGPLVTAPAENQVRASLHTAGVACTIRLASKVSKWSR